MLQVLNFTLAMHHHRHAYFAKPFLRIGVIWFLWLTVVVQAICIIMARNHYTADVVVACYVCPMLWYTLQNIYESPTFKRIYPSYMGNFKYDYASSSSDCEDIPIVKCMMRLGSIISRRSGFSVRFYSYSASMMREYYSQIFLQHANCSNRYGPRKSTAQLR